MVHKLGMPWIRNQTRPHSLSLCPSLCNMSADGQSMYIVHITTNLGVVNFKNDKSISCNNQAYYKMLNEKRCHYKESSLTFRSVRCQPPSGTWGSHEITALVGGLSGIALLRLHPKSWGIPLSTPDNPAFHLPLITRGDLAMPSLISYLIS